MAPYFSVGFHFIPAAAFNITTLFCPVTLRWAAPFSLITPAPVVASSLPLAKTKLRDGAGTQGQCSDEQGPVSIS
jgi:hypothetical protein